MGRDMKTNEMHQTSKNRGIVREISVSMIPEVTNWADLKSAVSKS